MTQLLVGDNRRVIAIETDQRLAEGLRASRDSDPNQWPGLEIVTADVLTTNIGNPATEKIHIYGNLSLLHHLAHPPSSFPLGRPNLSPSISSFN